jgi:outer membrane protein assembly factor BamE (lipoprotein component of BamABCDE complex)
MKSIRLSLALIIAIFCCIALSGCTTTKQENGVTIQKNRGQGFTETLKNFWPY